VTACLLRAVVALRNAATALRSVLARDHTRTHVNRTRFPCDITSSRPDDFNCEADWKVAKDAGKVVPVLSEVPHRDDMGGEVAV
jgi:hypothetical protein